jgi:protein-tyrosine phosphatase
MEKRIIDFHAHILPGADHGSRNTETTRAQLELLKKAGVGAVVATPHFYPQNDSVEDFLERRSLCAKELSAIDVERPSVYLGAEVLVCAGIDHMPGLEKLCIEGTDVILLEMPFNSWREEHIEAVARISRSGLTVVMAHIDRYPEKDVARLLSECDVLCQLNGETQLTFKGRRKAKRLLQDFPCIAAGSDLHGDDKRAVKNLLRLEKEFEKAGIDTAEEMASLLENAKSI